MDLKNLNVIFSDKEIDEMLRLGEKIHNKMINGIDLSDFNKIYENFNEGDVDFLMNVGKKILKDGSLNNEKMENKKCDCDCGKKIKFFRKDFISREKMPYEVVQGVESFEKNENVIEKIVIQLPGIEKNENNFILCSMDIKDNDLLINVHAKKHNDFEKYEYKQTFIIENYLLDYEFNEENVNDYFSCEYKNGEFVVEILKKEKSKCDKIKDAQIFNFIF